MRTINGRAMVIMLGLLFLFALFSDTTGNRAVCSLCQNEDHILHLLSNFPIHPISNFIEQLLQSSIVESPKESDSSVWYHLNLNQHNTVATTPITL